MSCGTWDIAGFGVAWQWFVVAVSCMFRVAGAFPNICRCRLFPFRSAGRAAGTVPGYRVRTIGRRGGIVRSDLLPGSIASRRNPLGLCLSYSLASSRPFATGPCTPAMPAEGFALVRRDFSGLVTACPAGCFPAEGGFVAVLLHPHDDGIADCPQPEEAYPAPVGGLPQGRLARCTNCGDQERKQ